jgi:hypothetical protein
MSELDAGADMVRIPADVDVEDRLIGDLSAHQVAVMAVAGVVVWLAWLATRHLVPPAVFLAGACPAGAVMVVLALGRRDGLSLDRLLAAAMRQARAPRRLVPAPEGIHPPPAWLDPTVTARARPLPSPLRLPATAIGPAGPVSLDDGGAVAVAAASTVNFALRTPAEQQALAAGFGRWLNSLAHPAQILIRAHRADLTAITGTVAAQAPALPHPALEQAALDHAGFLGGLAGDYDLLARQVLISVREPTTELAARRIADTAAALAAAGVAVTALDGAQTTAVLGACCHPGHPPQPTGTGGRA